MKIVSIRQILFSLSKVVLASPSCNNNAIQFINSYKEFSRHSLFAFFSSDDVCSQQYTFHFFFDS